MRIVISCLYRFSIPLKSPVKLARTVLYRREGLVVQLTDSENKNGFGEISPFPGFSHETLNEAESEIKNILLSSKGSHSSEYLEKSLTDSVPSVRFGIESALIELRAKNNGKRICELLADHPREIISINGLLAGTKEEILKKAVEYSHSEYRAIKLKVGSGQIENDIELTKLVRKLIGDKVLLRLDANRAWQIDDAQKFCGAVSELDIDYLEEPVVNSDELLRVLDRLKLAIPIALDETTREISPEELSKYDAKAIVIKPTLLGLEKSLQFAREAHNLGMTPVIGSSFESGLGLSTLAQIAAAVNSDDVPAGLDTYSWFADDIMKSSLPVKNGRLNLSDLADTETVLNSPLLKKLI